MLQHAHRDLQHTFSYVPTTVLLNMYGISYASGMPFHSQLYRMSMKLKSDNQVEVSKVDCQYGFCISVCLKMCVEPCDAGINVS